jgi:hypothetical protein
MRRKGTGVQTMNQTMYEYESLLYDAGKPGGAYVIFPYDIRKEFGKNNQRKRIKEII